MVTQQRAKYDGSAHHNRVAASRDQIDTVEVRHVIAFADPYDLDAPMTFLYPDSRCVAELMAGGIHPPIEVLHGLRLRLTYDDGTSTECDWRAASYFRATRKVISETLLDNRIVDFVAAPPMTYEQAIEWIMQKDVPFEVWGKKHNRSMMAIVPRAAVLEDRTHRKSWKLKDLAA